MKKKKIRLSVPLSEDIYNRLNEDADKIGVSQASFAAYVIGQYYNQLDSSIIATQETFKTLLETIFKDSNIDFKKIYDKGIETGYQTMDDIIKESKNKIDN